MKKLHFTAVIFLLLNISVSAQLLSNLDARSSEPVFSVYAAPFSRSAYKLDIAYQMRWSHTDEPISFYSHQSGNMGLKLIKNGKDLSYPSKMHIPPRVTATYSDVVRWYFYPVEGLKVESNFVVINSQTALLEYNFINETEHNIDIEAITFFDSGKDMPCKTVHCQTNGITIQHEYSRDSWMIAQNIPVIQERITNLRCFPEPDSAFCEAKPKGSAGFLYQIRLKKGEQKKIKLFRHTQSSNGDAKYDLFDEKLISEEITLERIRLNEISYRNIPVIEADYETQLTYYQCYTLMQQCMMPPEGECSYNYYIFSREPKWGWGYGGQVFHESLAMLSYALMNPLGAMNSQRVYIERQHADGYINYRTGPYLNEVIEHNGQKTSSAPWFNYQNLGIYKITHDTTFLEDCYASGLSYLNFFTTNRDKNNNGLYEWGGHAVLESVRDARVAVWDQVTWPAALEGPDINAMVYKEAVSLAEMADILGKRNQADSLKVFANKLKELINKQLWDTDRHFYFNRSTKSGTFSHEKPDDLKRLEIIGFLPMWAGVASPGNADWLIKHLKDSLTFNRPYGVPTLSASDTYYSPMGYWNGPVWLPWQYLVAEGLNNYGYQDIAKEIVQKNLKTVIWHLKTDHTFWEFYSPDQLHAGWNHTYIWSGILARMLHDIHKTADIDQ